MASITFILFFVAISLAMIIATDASSGVDLDNNGQNSGLQRKQKEEYEGDKDGDPNPLEEANNDRSCSNYDYTMTCTSVCGNATCYEETGPRNSYCLCPPKYPHANRQNGLTKCNYRKRIALDTKYGYVVKKDEGRKRIQNCVDKCDDMDLRPVYCKRTKPIGESPLICICVE